MELISLKKYRTQLFSPITLSPHAIRGLTSQSSEAEYQQAVKHAKNVLDWATGIIQPQD